MRCCALLALCVLAVQPARALDTAPPLADEVKQQRYEAMTQQLRCLQCKGETVAETSAKFAVDIRRQVREMIEAGKTDSQIRQYMVERYGEIILLKPLWTAGNAWLWVAPGLCLLGGIYVAARVLRQRRELLAMDTSEVSDERDAT